MSRTLSPDCRLKHEVHIARARAATHRFLKSETHIIVGDHEPELRNDVRADINANSWKLDPTPQFAQFKS